MASPRLIKRVLMTEKTGSRREVLTKTASFTLKNWMTGALINTIGAAGAVTVTLPASPKDGVWFEFLVGATQELNVEPGSNTISIDEGGTWSEQAAGDHISANAIGESATLVWSQANTSWITTNQAGTWTTP